MSRASFSIALVLLLTAGCQDRPDGTVTVYRPDDTPPPITLPEQPARPASMDGPLDGGQVLEVLRVLHENAVAQARLALQKGTDARVRRLASDLASEHQDAMERNAAVARRIAAAPRASQTSKQLEQELKLTTERLGHLAGTELDEQWANAQIEQHQAALLKLRELRRTIDTPELRTHVERLVQMVEQELRRVAALRAVLALAGGYHGWS